MVQRKKERTKVLDIIKAPSKKIKTKTKRPTSDILPEALSAQTTFVLLLDCQGMFFLTL